MQLQLHLHLQQLHVRRDAPFDYVVSPLRCRFFCGLFFSFSFSCSFLSSIFFIFSSNSMLANTLQLISTIVFSQPTPVLSSLSSGPSTQVLIHCSCSWFLVPGFGSRRPFLDVATSRLTPLYVEIQRQCPPNRQAQ